MLSSGNEALEYERTFAWLSVPFVLQGQVLPNFQVKIFNLKVRKHNYSALVFFRTFGLTTTGINVLVYLEVILGHITDLYSDRAFA
jgi:hypothetical protein